METNFTKFKYLTIKHWIIFILVWLIIVLTSFYFKYSSINNDYYSFLLNEGRNFFQIIELTAEWNSIYGGVYVDAKNQTQFIPYGKHNSKLLTQNGRELTKISPPHMLRQFSELAKKQNPKIISFDFNKQNSNVKKKKDQLIKSLKLNKNEILELNNNKNIVSFTSPLIIKKSCLNCHGEKYKVGDQFSSMTINFDINNTLRSKNEQLRNTILIHLGIFGIGFLSILLFFSKIKKGEQLLNSKNENLETLISQRNENLKNVYQQMYNNNIFLKSIFEALTHPFYIVNTNDFTIELANSSAGLSKSSLKSRCYEISHGLNNPCNENNYPCPLSQVVATKKPYTTEHLHYDKNGTPKYVEIHAYPVFDEQGHVKQMIEYVLDITERKEAEKQLRYMKNHLQELVEERTEELERASEELIDLNSQLEISIFNEKELSKLKDEFTSNINHELKTPLTAILLASKYILKRIDKLDKEQIRERVFRIELAGKNLLNLVNELLDFSKLDSGNMPYRQEKINLNFFIEELKDNFIDLFNEKKINLILDAEETFTIENDINHLSKIFNNILSNALKFTDEGYVKLSVKENNSDLHFKIEDTGIGINKDNLNTIFERFKQGTIDKNKAPGTGIGLHIVKTLLEKHGGSIHVESKIDKGTTFHIKIPKISKWKIKRSS